MEPKRRRAGGIQVRLVPPLLGVSFFFAFVWAAFPLAGGKGLLASGLIGVARLVPLTQFATGRVDHHGWQLLLAMVTAGAVFGWLSMPDPPLLQSSAGRPAA